MICPDPCLEGGKDLKDLPGVVFPEKILPKIRGEGNLQASRMGPTNILKTPGPTTRKNPGNSRCFSWMK